MGKQNGSPVTTIHTTGNNMSPVNLVILAGGTSSRFGSDKGLFTLHGRTMIERALHLWQSSDKWLHTYIVTGNSEQKTSYESALDAYKNSVTVLQDQDLGPVKGPLCGIYTAISYTNQNMLIVPVDQIGLRLDHLTYLVEEATKVDAPMATYLQNPFPMFISNQIKSVLPPFFDIHPSMRYFVEHMKSHVITPPDSFIEPLQWNMNTHQEKDTYFKSPLFDGFNRRIQYARISLTEACNLSCHYCLPDGFPEWYRHKAKLSLPLLQEILKALRNMDFTKVRFTGGEPTVHPDYPKIIQKAYELGFEEIALTTNGLLIDDIKSLMELGLTSMNISLDSHQPEIFTRMTKSRGIEKIIKLIDQALTYGLPLKLNAVLLKSINGHREHIHEFIEWAMQKPLELRFIELMDTGLNSKFAKQERISNELIKEILLENGFLYHSTPTKVAKGPAKTFFHPNYPGRVGLISPFSCNFCDACNRIRIRANGHLKMCLFGHDDIPLPVTEGAAAIEGTIRQNIGKKPERHGLLAEDFGNVHTFRTIGG